MGLGIAVSVLTVAGCSPPPADAPSFEPPEVGDCLVAGTDEAVNCKERHVAEVVFVGEEAPGTDLEALEPCRRAQRDYLGQDFNTRLDVRLWVAQDESWYRCDVVLRKSTRAAAGYEVLTGSLRGVLRKGVGVDLQACLDSAYKPAADQTYVPCDEPHTTRQLIASPAIGTLAEGFPADIDERATNACNATAAAAGELAPGRTVIAFYPNSADAWAAGERSADCWLSADRGLLPGVRPNAR